MLAEILIIFLLLLANAAFAMAEMAVATSSKARLKVMSEWGHSGARKALEMAEDPNHLLSSVQIGITLIATLTGAFGGTTVADELALYLVGIPSLAPQSEGLALALVVLPLAFFSLIIGELAPKRIALSSPERIASLCAPFLYAFSRLVSPAIRLLGLCTDLVLKALGVGPSAGPSVTEEEIRILIDQGTDAGVIEEDEQDIMERVFSLGDRRVDSIMTPRGDIVWLDIDDTIEEIQRKISVTSFSMFPVCRGRLDDVLGIVESRDLLKCNLADHKMDLKSSLMPPLFVPESMRALKVLERFKLTGVHLAVVLDEYGSVQGIVALVDLLEGLVGDIPHIDELEEPQMVKREDGSYLVDGAMTVDEFRDALKLHIQPSEQEGQYKTVGGFMMAHLEKIPAAGDYFEWEGYRFEVVDMDERKVDKVLAAPLPAKRGKREKK
ncbi:MAG TPA: hemolysin family protein [Methanothrix sp.]|nr:hemolysin family protein [Methanothrix sp.]HPT19413.1 hemolysin family protein [Methanothrix sp.]